MFPISTTDLQTRQKFCWTACCQMMSWRKHCIVKYYYHNNALTSTSSSSSSSLGATTLGGFWPALRFRFTIFYLYTSVSNFSLSSSLNLLLLLWAISVLVFLLVLMSMFPTQLVFLTVLIVSILITCAAQRNLCNFINLTIVSFVIRISNVPLHQTRQYRETQVKVHDSNTYCTFFTLTYCFYRKHINIYMGWWMKSGTYVLKVCNCIAYVTLSITQTPKYT